jgi:hypothetical protein
MRQRSTAIRVFIGVAIAGVIAAAPHFTSASPMLPGGHARAMNQLPKLVWEAQHGYMPTNLKASTTPPAGNISNNITFLSNLPLPSAISIAFIGHTAFVSTVLGVYSVDITDPANPQILGALSTPIWENESMSVDPARNLIFIARDPRNFTSPVTDPVLPDGALDIVDVSNPRAMVILSEHTQPTGHTAVCINDCSYLWISGPASPAVAIQGGASPGWGGRPVWGVNITNPLTPTDCPDFIDLNNHNGVTDYDHHVDVDANGIAWITGSGHIRGYWTTGDHYNYADGRTETATACKPIEYAGFDTNEGQITVQGGVMHNGGHDLNVLVDGRPDVIAATEEVVTSTCGQAGETATYDIGTATQPQNETNPNFTLPPIGTWTPEGQPGSTGCDSSHWFKDNGQGILAQAFYSQGTRILDIRDPRNIKQVGWYNVADQTGQARNDTWAAYWYDPNPTPSRATTKAITATLPGFGSSTYIVVADFQRGLDILRFDPSVAPGPVADVPDMWPGAAVALALLTVASVVAVRRRRVTQRA